ncbi:MAG TPA: hypothetical protein VGL89_18480 [Candidatus Koribacter sp.]|jgi:hypothetical protein
MKITIQPALSAVLAGALVFAPLAAEAQQQTATPQDPQQQSQPAAQQPQTGTTVNPAQGPLTPVPTNQDQNQLPESPQAQQPGQTVPAQNTTPQPTPQTQNPTEPLGTATAPGVGTVGGGASKPAGTAIAPAKQRQYHSLLIKLGLVAGAGVALGTVYALSKGTSSVPPNSGR